MADTKTLVGAVAGALVSFIDEKAVSEWLTQNSDSAALSAMAQIVLYKAGK